MEEQREASAALAQPDGAVTVDTGGGAHITGAVHTAGGALIGRDHITYAFPAVQPPPVDEATLAADAARLAALPLDRVPDPAPLPAGSRLPYRPNPLFTGREVELRTLASALRTPHPSLPSPAWEGSARRSWRLSSATATASTSPVGCSGCISPTRRPSRLRWPSAAGRAGWGCGR